MEAIENLFQQVGRMQWTDYLDIIIVAFLIYWLLPLLRTTGTGRIAKIVVAILVVASLTEVLNLYTLRFIINQFLAIGLLALVVLFQPELRRMIDHLSNVKLKRLFSGEKIQEEMLPIIAQTVRACEVMSRERVGALIVFARDSRLEEYFKTAPPTDSRVSGALVRNTFVPQAARHGGALVSRDGGMAAAGCVLRLSESDRLSADLGTRHRAGVGMSENSDAVVVIVSEETGAISVAIGGMLKRHLAPQTLERLLRNELCHDQPEQEQGLVVTLRQKLHKWDKGGHKDEK